MTWHFVRRSVGMPSSPTSCVTASTASCPPQSNSHTESPLICLEKEPGKCITYCKIPVAQYFEICTSLRLGNGLGLQTRAKAKFIDLGQPSPRRDHPATCPKFVKERIFSVRLKRVLNHTLAIQKHIFQHVSNTPLLSQERWTCLAL